MGGHSHGNLIDNFDMLMNILKRNLNQIQKLPMFSLQFEKLQDRFKNYNIPAPGSMNKADAKWKRIVRTINERIDNPKSLSKKE
jgi:hypothetical protein